MALALGDVVFPGPPPEPELFDKIQFSHNATHRNPFFHLRLQDTAARTALRLLEYIGLELDSKKVFENLLFRRSERLAILYRPCRFPDANRDFFEWSQPKTIQPGPPRIWGISEVADKMGLRALIYKDSPRVKSWPQGRPNCWPIFGSDLDSYHRGVILTYVQYRGRRDNWGNVGRFPVSFLDLGSKCRDCNSSQFQRAR